MLMSLHSIFSTFAVYNEISPTTSITDDKNNGRTGEYDDKILVASGALGVSSYYFHFHQNQICCTVSSISKHTCVPYMPENSPHQMFQEFFFPGTGVGTSVTHT